jgi:chemotaxis protein MotB
MTTMSRWTVFVPLFATVALFAAACGVPEAKYKASVAEADKLRESYTSESQRVKACEAKISDLQGRVSQLEEEAEQQRRLAGSLAKTKEQLEAERAAAAREAEAQRARAAALEKKSAEYETLTASLAQEIKEGKVQISELEGKMTVRLAERVLFPSGSDRINKQGLETLAKIGETFRSVQGRIVRVEGYTDNVPIRTVRFPSNWELSAARAIAVVRVLEQQGVDPATLGAVGYGEHQPIAPNDTSEGRQQNRRIEITLAAPPRSLSTK